MLLDLAVFTRSVSYNELSQENAARVKAQVASSNASITTLARSVENKYDISLSTVQDTRIVILNEETGNNVVITPTENAPAQFQLQPFFIEELRRAVLGDADRYLLIEAGTDFSVRNATSVSRISEEVFIPRYFYGPKENVKEALPADRQIIHIFKERPRLIPASDDPEHLRLVARLEEEMSYYVYMYKLPDGTLIIFDEHFVNPNAGKNEIRTNTNSGISTNLQFSLSDNFNSFTNLQWMRDLIRGTTRHAYGLWSERLAGTVPVSIRVRLVPGSGLGSAYFQPHYRPAGSETWYSTALGRQMAGYDFAPGVDDILINMNSTLSQGRTWNFSMSVPGDEQHDWLSVMLHEITHGLGFASLIHWDDNNPQDNGRFFYTTSNEKEEFTNYPGAFDRQLYRGSTGLNYYFPDLTQSQRADAVVSNDLFAGRPGSHLLAANDGNRVRMYAPFYWDRGSSVSHWHPSGETPTLMRPRPILGRRNAVIDVREIAIMYDMGWETICSFLFTNQTVTTNRTVTTCDSSLELEIGDVNVVLSTILCKHKNYLYSFNPFLKTD